MTTWNDVINHVRQRYEVLEDTDGWLRLRMDTGDGRTQQVALHHLPDLDWVEISSPVGKADAIDAHRLLELAGASEIGGAAVVDGVALLKHTVHLSVDEFERVLQLLVARADALEAELTEADDF
ncbi:hypothetical protein FKR81_38530 [Lentzea tibetensis]|uniref:Uncharacterized protein n=1 Tax=Lentzea tibetensis TaxID=2591470 RepID=A0A563EHL6_9PSEU|nr:hypothetical protein [Lentzea tibetensis]TWP45731.1 hypothetical protein FKR81_38530 [Lentzea tibetensis]